MASTNPSASTSSDFYRDGSPPGDAMDLDSPRAEEMDLDENPEGRSTPNNGQKHVNSGPSSPAAKRRRGNEYHPHGSWTVQAGAFHIGRVTPHDKAASWPAPSEFDAFFHDLTGDAGLDIAQERVDLARLYTRAEGDSDYVWGELGSVTRLNIIEGLLEVNRREEAVRRETGGYLEAWDQLSDDATVVREELQAAQHHFDHPDDWMEHDVRQRVAADDIEGLRPAASVDSDPETITNGTKGKTVDMYKAKQAAGFQASDDSPKPKDSSRRERLIHPWDPEEDDWCIDYATEKYEEFGEDDSIDPAHPAIDWGLWKGLKSKAMNQLLNDHHAKFAGRRFEKHTKDGGLYPARPLNIEEHRNVDGIQKHFRHSKNTKWRDLMAKIEADNLRKGKGGRGRGGKAAPTPAGGQAEMEQQDKVTLTKVEPRVQGAGSYLSVVPDPPQPSFLDGMALVEPVASTMTRQQSRAENTLPGYAATNFAAPTPFEAGEPARRRISIDEDYDEDEEGGDAQSALPLRPAHPSGPSSFKEKALGR